MTQLALLRSQLNALRRRRALVRTGNAFATVTASLLLVAIGLFFLDWAFEPSPTWRIALWALGLGAFLWAFLKYTRPWLGKNESLVDIALMVEKHQQIDSDLVGALQFEEPHAQNWGSKQLQQAVVTRVARVSPDLDVFTGFSYEKLGQRLMVLTVVLGVVAVLGILFPQNLEIFGRRMLLFAQQHYPTKTQIVNVKINGQEVYPSESATFHAPQGQPLVFEVLGGGELPLNGNIKIKSLHNDVVVDVPLEKEDSENQETVTYTGRLPKLIDSVVYQVYLGDAWTDPRIVELIPLPVVSVNLTPHPPKYARDDFTGEQSREGVWQLSVIEGSRVDLGLRCTNKVLKNAKLVIEGKEYPLTSPAANSADTPTWDENVISQVTSSFLPPEERKEEWVLNVEGTPLENVKVPLRYQIYAEDTDGLSLAAPIQGYIGIKTDQPPRIAAGLLFPRYLGTATPQIYYGVADDYGVSQLQLHMEVVRSTPPSTAIGASEPQPGTMKETRQIPLQLADGQPPRMIRSSYALELAPLNLVKGDMVKITLEAYDFRGEGEPKSKVSEPLVLTITDRVGLGEDLNDINRLSVRQMEAIIQQQLGIGDSQ